MVAAWDGGGAAAAWGAANIIRIKMVIFPLVLQPNGRWKLNGTCEYILKKLRHIQKAIMMQQHNPLPFATWHASAHELASRASSRL